MTWYSHEYARAFGAGIHINPDEWDIGHPGEPQGLLQRLDSSMPGKNMRVLCSDTVLLVEVETTDFDGGELTTVANDIAAQKAVVDWPWTMADMYPHSIMREDFEKATGPNTIVFLAAVNGNGNSAPDDQPNSPCSTISILAGSGGTTDVDITITGKLANGRDGTEVINTTGGNGTYIGVKAFMTISDIAYSGVWDGGNITIKNGSLLGLCNKFINSVFKEVFDGVDQAIGIFDSTYMTYNPTGVLDGAKKLELWLEPIGFCE